MRRRRRPHRDGAQDLLDKLRKITESDLSEIGRALESQLRFVLGCAAAGACEPHYLQYVISNTEAIVRMLPPELGERFWFDAQMIQSVKENWNRGGQRLSGTIIPNYSSEWSHARDFIPSESGSGQGKSINVIYFPGRDDLGDVNLLAYPFMCHELGHNLFFYDDAAFVTCVEDELRKVTGSLRLRSLPDKGAAAAKAVRLIDEMQEFWSPSSDHKNWAHEMGMDMVALWACGPAYLAVFQETVEDQAKDPYLISKEHPPYAMRVDALIKAAERLGWTAYTGELKQIVKEWPGSRRGRNLNNRYVALADARLVDACVSCTLSACEKLSLPKCDADEVKRVSALLRRGETPGFGTELILAAWLVERQLDEGAYERWERATVRNLAASITQ